MATTTAGLRAGPGFLKLTPTAATAVTPTAKPPPAKPASNRAVKKTTWNVLAATAAIGAAWAARQAATALWHRMSDAEPAEDPADRTVSWGQAAGWAVLAGIAGGLARVIATRGAAAAWQGVTGETPPGVRKA